MSAINICGAQVDQQLAATYFKDLPQQISVAMPDPVVSGNRRPLSEVECDYINSVLKAWVAIARRRRAELRIATATLYRKLKEYGSVGR